MDQDSSEKLDIDNLSKKETYTAEEKKMIMDWLNEQRLIQQKEEESLSGKKQSYTEEKRKILNDLNERRLSDQRIEEIKKNRTQNKEIYKIGSKEFYKFINMKREYFIEIKDCEKISRRPRILSLYYRSIDILHKKDVLIKAEIYSEKFFISMDPIRVYYKGYSLEDKR
jgi:hypothetical protein